MPKPDPVRIAEERLTPHILQLWRALVPLKSVVSFMNTGAHPDDEHSEMLAALSFRDGVDISYACSTRGEGGQNNLGLETGSALGVLRTAEMERACDVLNMRMYWLSESPEDSITDFGFSKSGKDTLARWGRARTIQRFVDILRLERPDIICPTFLDVPGQHGHHRAMTEAASEAFDLAADPAYRASFYAPWQVKKLYLPAWSGAGQAYDDEAPPPAAHVTVDGRGVEPVSGWSYARIGQQSRACHASQGMGEWIAAGEERDFPLHLAKSVVAAAEEHLTSGLAVRLTDLTSTGTMAAELSRAQNEMDQAIAAFPDSDAVLKHASSAMNALRSAQAGCPSKLAPEILHKLVRKEEQLATVIRIASRVDLHAVSQSDQIAFGQASEYAVEVRAGVEDQLSIVPDLRQAWTEQDGVLQLSEMARASNPYPSRYLPCDPPRPCLKVELETHGVTSHSFVPFNATPIAIPAYTAQLVPSADVLNRAQENRRIQVKIRDLPEHVEKIGFDIPNGWQQERTADGIDLIAPQDVSDGRYEFDLLGDGVPLQSVTQVAYPHVAHRALCTPARLRLSVFDVTLPRVRVGYIGGGNDRVDHWLVRLGLDVTVVSDEALQDDAELSQFDCIVIGIFAMKMRQGLLDAMPALHRWTKAGGTLLTLYHRPWDNWDPQTVPPKRLEIGQPSLRWRVTDAAAPVTVLAEDHALLNEPNKIGASDWADWHKERGLYFAKEWEVSYVPLLAMSDSGEVPLNGSLLAADVGQGRHVHCSLILHHQMENLVQGAFRIMANLVAKRGA